MIQHFPHIVSQLLYLYLLQIAIQSLNKHRSYLSLPLSNSHHAQSCSHQCRARLIISNSLQHLYVCYILMRFPSLLLGLRKFVSPSAQFRSLQCSSRLIMNDDTWIYDIQSYMRTIYRHTCSLKAAWQSNSPPWPALIKCTHSRLNIVATSVGSGLISQ